MDLAARAEDFGLDSGVKGIRPLTDAEIDMVSGAWNWQEAAIVTTGGMVSGAAGTAAATWYLGGGVLPATAAGTVGGVVAGFVGYTLL